jgi:ParB family chromosome partitioning protein
MTTPPPSLLGTRFPHDRSPEMTINTDPERPALVVTDYDPRTLIVDLNIRDLKPDKGLVDSIRDLGVLQPVIGYRRIDGSVRVRYGHRRTLAAIEAGRTAVPVLVVADEADGGDVDRILGQYAENKHREGLTVADEAGVVAQLLDLGLTAAQVQKRTRMPKAAVAAAKTLHGSAIATQAAAAHPELTIDQAAAIAEFDQDAAAVSRLVQAARYGDGQFKHGVEQLREERADEQAYAAAAAACEADAITVVEKRPSWDFSVERLADADGQPLTDETHKACPGHVAHLVQGWDDDSDTVAWRPQFYCSDPPANGHQQRFGSTAAGGIDLEAQRADRSNVIKGNKAWRTAETVRRDWLTQFLARKEAPKNALRYVIESITPTYCELTRSGAAAHELAGKLLGLDISVAEAVTVARASDARALVITLGLVLSATEAETDVHAWRTGPANHPHIARYLKALTGWGYTLSPIEQAVADGKNWAPAESGASR